MFRLILFIAIVLASDAFAQGCNSLITVVSETTGEKTPTARKHIIVKGDQNKQFDITALTSLNTLVLVVNVRGGFPCVATGDPLEVAFTDQSTLTLINNYHNNCEGITAVYLGPEQRNLSLLTHLSTKAIASLKVWTRGSSMTLPFNEGKADSLRSTIICLGSYLTTSNYKGDSIPSYTKPIYSADTTRVYMVVDAQPEFEGGYAAMMDFIQKNVRYPHDALRSGAKGTVYVSFIINEEGTILHPRVLRGVYPALDLEALRVVNLMPRWKPGMQGGQPVKVRFNLPIKFNMQMKSESKKKRD